MIQLKRKFRVKRKSISSSFISSADSWVELQALSARHWEWHNPVLPIISYEIWIEGEVVHHSIHTLQALGRDLGQVQTSVRRVSNKGYGVGGLQVGG